MIYFKNKSDVSNIIDALKHKCSGLGGTFPVQVNIDLGTLCDNGEHIIFLSLFNLFSVDKIP